MERQKFLRRGWICGLMAPVACLLFILLRETGVLESGSPFSVVLVSILMVEMLVATAAPFWWLLTLYRRGRTATERPAILVGLNIFAIIVSVVFFF